MATWTIRPNGDRDVSDWSKETGSGNPLYLEIDEDIASPDNTGLKGTAASSVNRLYLDTVNPPADFDPSAITGVSFQLRTKQSGRVDDTLTNWEASIGKLAGGILAGASSSTNSSITTSNIYATSYLNSNVVAAAYIDNTANIAVWNSSVLQLFSPAKTNVKGADSVTLYIDCFDIVVTYTPTASEVTTAMHSSLAAMGVGR